MSELIHVYADAAGAADACALTIAAWVVEAIVERGKAALAVSGGSTPKLMFRTLAGLGLDWSKIHLFWVDERVVAPDDEQSNYRMTLESLIVPAGIAGDHVHRVFGEFDPRDAALSYAEEIEGFFEMPAGGIPRFDAVQCGVGDDGHTASLFPGESLVSDRRGLVACVWSQPKQQWRVTLLPGPILAARHLCVLASGTEKAAAVQKALHGAEDPVRVPAQLLRGGEWFIDRAAAADL